MRILDVIIRINNKQCKVEDVDIAIPLGKKQYFGLSHLYDGAYRARFTTIIKNTWDAMCRQTCPVECEAYSSGVAFNLFRGSKLLAKA